MSDTCVSSGTVSLLFFLLLNEPCSPFFPQSYWYISDKNCISTASFVCIMFFVENYASERNHSHISPFFLRVGICYKRPLLISWTFSELWNFPFVKVSCLLRPFLNVYLAWAHVGALLISPYTWLILNA